jgi:hypothetical protein
MTRHWQIFVENLSQMWQLPAAIHAFIGEYNKALFSEQENSLSTNRL